MKIHSQIPPQDERDEGPWYRQFWAWFVFAPLLLVMLAWIPFMTIVLKNADDVVIDNYYKEGRMYNMRLEQDHLAQKLGLSGELFVDKVVGEVLVSLSAAAKGTVLPQQLLLHLDHPLEADNDLTIKLLQTYPGRYIGQLEHSIHNRWYIRLTPLQEESSGDSGMHADDASLWRITGEFDLSKQARMQFGEHE